MPALQWSASAVTRKSATVRTLGERRTSSCMTTERMQEKLDNYVRPRAAEVRTIRNNPQEMQRFCREQDQKAIDALMKY